MTKAILVDIRRCIACRGCQVSCKRWNDREAEATSLSAAPGTEWTNPQDLSPQTYTYIRFIGNGKGDDFRWHFVKRQCMHCTEPGCASVCPTHALYKTDEGPVLYDKEKCIGCGYCRTGCPFDVPRFDSETRVVEKCTFCAERMAEGLEPACVQACPTDALVMDEREKILEKVDNEVAEGAYVYGKDEVGGTSWIYLSDVPFSQLGFPAHGPEPQRAFTTDLLSKFAVTGIIGGAMLYGIKRFSDRRKKVEEGE